MRRTMIMPPILVADLFPEVSRRLLDVLHSLSADEWQLPTISSPRTVIDIADLRRAVDFYSNVLGFSVAWRAADDGGGENAMLVAGAIRMLLSTGTHLGDKPQSTGTLYFDITGVDAFFEAIKDRVEIVWPLETMEYGQMEFGIRDLDGYMLAFAESVEDVG